MKSDLSDLRQAPSCFVVLTSDQSCVPGVVEISLEPSRQLANLIHKITAVTVQSRVVSLETRHAPRRQVGTARKLKMHNRRLLDCLSSWDEVVAVMHAALDQRATRGNNVA